MDLLELQSVNDSSRHIVLKYLIKVADIPQDTLFKTALEYLPKDKELFMTVEEQLIHKGEQRGLEQGWRQGLEEGMQKVAERLLSQGTDIRTIAAITDLSIAEIQTIRQRTHH